MLRPQNEEALHQIVSDTSNYFNFLANFVASPYYLRIFEDGVFPNTPKPNRGNSKKNVPNIKRWMRYDPNYWRSSTSVLAEFNQKSSNKIDPTTSSKGKCDSSTTSNQNKQQRVKLHEQVSKGDENEEQLPISRDDLRKKLHDKITALQAQSRQQKQHQIENKKDKANEKRQKTQDAMMLNKKPKKENFNPSNNHQSPTRAKINIDTNANDFQFNNDVLNDNQKQNNNKSRSTKGQKLKAALEHIVQKQETHAQLSQEEQKEASRKEALDQAYNKAAGVKVYDNPKRLKKALKVRERKITKSKTRWEERKQNVEKGKIERQRKRQQNINDRINKKKQKKNKK